MEKPSPSLKNPLYPIPTEELIKKANKVVSVVLHGSQISWCCIERCEDKTFHLKQLEFQPLGYKNRLHFLSSLHEVIKKKSSITFN